MVCTFKEKRESCMQQLEIVYSGIKGAILVRENSGPPTEELPLFNLKKEKAQFIVLPF